MRKKHGKHGGAGHGWYVTFADLMGLLMSFFVMVAAYSSQDQEKMQQVVGSMRDAFGVQADAARAGIIELEGAPTRTELLHKQPLPVEDSSQTTGPRRDTDNVDGIPAQGSQGFSSAAATLRQALQAMPEIAELSRHIVLEETDEGLDISLIDEDGRSMFPEGSPYPYERTRQLLVRLAPVLLELPNRVTIAGHTTAVGEAAAIGSSAWELSSGRANAVRRLLEEFGLPRDRFAAIVGKADTEPLFPDDPFLAANRRISILLMKEEPPLPPGFQP